MNFIRILKELWRRRLLVALAAFVALAGAVLAVYNVSVSPPGLSKRGHAEAHGSVEILVDSAKSPIADVARELEPLTARAGVFARYIAGGNVIKRISASTGIPLKQIEVAGPVPLPGEAIGASAPPEQMLPYGFEVVQRDELPIVNVATRAPTLEEARELAAATPAAVREIVSRIQEEQGIPDSKKVTFRVLGPAQAHVSTEALGAKVAIMIFLLLFAIGILLIIGIPRLIDAWRSVDDEPSGPAVHEAGFAPISPMDLPTISAQDPPSLAPAESYAERAQLEMRHGGGDG